MLASLQDAHVRTVPFENLDIHLGVPLSLDVDDLVAKVVKARRGGFCFELNGLFHAVLEALGFDAWLVEARVIEDDGALGPRFDHARIAVALPDTADPVIVDVGTGASPRAPLRLSPGEQQIGHTRQRVRRVGDRFVSDRLGPDGWETGWSFTLDPQPLSAFEGRCRYHQQDPASHFTQKPLCTLVTTDGHITLSDRQLITTRGSDRHEAPVDDPLTTLREVFGIELPRWPGSPA